ncbi:efflux RND transporter periplasmic adaptor subunit [Larkinella sp. C7]|uniref:efflux RND transporter periplasmic adaptor subunit n=1 Tax=Larkinella sp. C7 TaxID=2576607 RepID=UPI0011113BE6|nr:efflux RND transporter periplasmic adaptor subunit [Larkinella sp. C7]
MLRQWIYGSAALLVLLNAACQSGGSTATKSKDTTQLQADTHPHLVGGSDGHSHGPEQEGGTTYTCPMHPQVMQSAPGTCPICAMDLVPVTKTGGKGADRSAVAIILSESQMQLAHVTVQPVSAGSISNATVLNARLAANQEQTEVISSRVSGRIERLVVKESGQFVRKGQVLYEIYSEQLLTDQQEYLVALQQENELKEPRYEQFRKAAEQKLRLSGMTPDQIRQLARTRKVQPRIPFVAPAGGTVTEVAASEGQYVSEGALLYRLVNLGQLWVEADLYAGESNYIKVGDQVGVEVVGSEERLNLTARVAFINPEYRTGSQVLTMRAILANPGSKFQPGQQARVFIRHGIQRGLTLPTDAVVRAGDGAVVFIQTGTGTFRPRKVETGTETDQRVAITKGLIGTEKIAMSGAYLLYSELILKKGINPITAKIDEEDVQTASNQKETPVAEQAASPNVQQTPDAFKKQLTLVYEASLKLTEALIRSDARQAQTAAGGAEKAISSVDMNLLSGATHQEWMKHESTMKAALKIIRTTNNLEKQRTAFAGFEDGLYRSVKAFGITDKPAYRQYCPMAQNNKGGYWLSDQKTIRNPYFGEAMLSCGETKEVIQ